MIVALSVVALDRGLDSGDKVPDLAPPDWGKWDTSARDAFEERLAVCLESGDVPESEAVRIAAVEARRIHCNLEGGVWHDGRIDALLEVFGDEMRLLDTDPDHAA